MDKIELQQKLTQPFDSDQWKEVVETVFPGSQFYAQSRTVPSVEDMVEQIADKGTVRLADGKNIALVELRLKPGSVHLQKNRVKLRSLVAKLIDQERAHGVIAVFEQGEADYRLSFVAREAVLEDGEFKIRETPAKRFTFLLGPDESCRTAAERLYALSQKQELTLDDVTEAFSVEKLNKEFYRHIQKYFYELIGGKVDDRHDFTGCMTLPSLPIAEHHKAYSEFAVRLLGRVVFCWFLKHKRCDQNRPLIPDELLSSEAVESHTGYYHKILEKLFFQTLNKPMNERSKYAPEFAHLIPYLNGGLFDPHSDDFYEEGAIGESKHINTLLIPDDWFLRLFQTLEMYNFTIDENTALDTDVSIDPEILGRIFENLLAEINPETGDSARKATGSFYTPREIVDYMVEESLLQHLKTSLNVDEASSLVSQNQKNEAETNEAGSIVCKLRALFVEDDKPHNLDDKTRRAVVDAFRTIKVLDPACGSGAFPVGILQKMLCVLRKVDPENDLWLQAQIDQIHEMKLGKQEEDRRLDEIDHAFKTNEADYGRKLGIIQNSVYGVDIQPIAIEISKLRFFLTLVVDEKIEENENNRGILPLPNLDFKFVCANTLIPAPEIENTGDELNLEYYPNFFKDFTALTEQYFYAGTPAGKQSIREQLSECVSKKIKGEWDKVEHIQANDLLEHASWSARKKKKVEEERKELVSGLNLWRSYKNIFTGQPVDFFDPKYMFPDAGEGFDVVIANPPYVQITSDKFTDSAVQGLKIYESYRYKADLYHLFLEAMVNLLRDGGVSTVICPMVWMTLETCQPLRNFLLENCSIKTIRMWGESVFSSAVVNTMTGVFSKGTVASVIPVVTKKLSFCLPLDAVSNDPRQKINFRLTPQTRHVIEKFDSRSSLIADLCEVSQGITPYDKYKGHTQSQIKSRCFHSEKKHDATYGIWLNGRDISRWCIRHSGEWLSYGDWLGSPRDPKFFKSEKIFCREVPGSGKQIQAALHEVESYTGHAASPVIAKDGSAKTLRFVLAILNSRAMSWYAGICSPNFSKDIFPKLNPSDIKALPVPVTTPTQQAEIEEWVERILAQKKENPEADVSALETEIDQLVYELYDLTEEEIRIIDPEYQPVAVAPPAEKVNEGHWVLSMLAYLHVNGSDLIAQEEMTMAHILIMDDNLRKRVLKGGRRKASSTIKRIENVDQLWAKFDKDQFAVVATPTETAIGLGPKATPLSKIESHSKGRYLVEKAKEARVAIEKINKTCETPEERFVMLERTYESVGNV